MARINVNVNPNVLLWARQEAGYSAEEIAIKLSVDLDLYKTWENDGKAIPIGKLRKLVTYFKRQLAFFFLPKPPVNRINYLYDISELGIKSREVNKEIISLYWKIGETIVQKLKEIGWGKSVVEQLSKDIRKISTEFKAFHQEIFGI